MSKFWERVGNWLWGTREELTEQLVQDLVAQQERARISEAKLKTVTDELRWARRCMGEQNTQLARLDEELRVCAECIKQLEEENELLEQDNEALQLIVVKYRGDA